MKDDDDIDCVILFSGTWVWAAHLIAAIRDFAMTGKGVLIWTHPGSQGWRPVGGLVLHGGAARGGHPRTSSSTAQPTTRPRSTASPATAAPRI